MSMMHSGACLCGAIKVDISIDPIAVLSCFCEHCNKGAGAPNQVVRNAPAEALSPMTQGD